VRLFVFRLMFFFLFVLVFESRWCHGEAQMQICSLFYSLVFGPPKPDTHCHVSLLIEIFYSALQ
jgi:hypothetical protein